MNTTITEPSNDRLVFPLRETFFVAGVNGRQVRWIQENDHSVHVAPVVADESPADLARLRSSTTR